jgi:hypothetical protein
VVGRGGLEPPTSAVTGAERCAYDLRELDLDERCSRCYVVALLSRSETVRLELHRQLVHFVQPSLIPYAETGDSFAPKSAPGLRRESREAAAAGSPDTPRARCGEV